MRVAAIAVRATAWMVVITEAAYKSVNTCPLVTVEVVVGHRMHVAAEPASASGSDTILPT